MVYSTKNSYRFTLFNAPKNPIVLGYPWLAIHNPNIPWTEGELCQWSMLSTIAILQYSHWTLLTNNHLTTFPECYQDLSVALSKNQSFRTSSTHIDHGIATLIYCQVLPFPRAKYTPYWQPKQRLWENILKQSRLVLHALPLLLQQGFSQLRKGCHLQSFMNEILKDLLNHCHHLQWYKNLLYSHSE